MDDGIISYTRLAITQRVFGVLMDIFDRVGLHTNVGNTVNMVCQLCKKIGGHYAETYGIWITGEVLIHKA